MTIRLYVGSDPQQHKAERALEASVRANTTQPVDITWMRQGSPGWDWGGLDVGWATPFSMFRWAVPEACDYRGRAIYMDADMLALGDLTELWEWPIPDGKAGMFAGRHPTKADVIVWDCARVPKWDRADFEGRDSQVRKEAGRCLSGCKLPAEWDHCDMIWPDTKVLHFTSLRHQPHKPYQTRYDYDLEHPCPEAVALFWDYYQRSLDASAEALSE